MNCKHILFVEDEKIPRDSLSSAVDDWNQANAAAERAFAVHFAENFDTAEQLLDRQRFDCALFDLRIPGGGRGHGQSPPGNELALSALKTRAMPVAIISGQVGELEEQLREEKMVKCFNKGDRDPYEAAIAWFGGDWEMMDVLAGSRRQMDEAAAEVFLRRIWPNWEIIAALPNADQATVVGIVTRQYAGQVAELLGIDSENSVGWHPYECYISPSLLTDRAHTGDLLTLDGELWVVLTPQCDMATQKVANVLVAKCLREIPNWADRRPGLAEADGSSLRKKAENFFKDLVNQNVPASKHFLPPLPGEQDPLLVDFSHLKVVSLDQLKADLSIRRASVAPAFLTNLTQRFGAYISRTGQPNIDVVHFR